MQPARPKWSSRTKLTVVLLVVGLSLYLLYRFSAVIKPVVLATILAYILTPVANWFQGRLKVHRGVATLLSYLVLLITVGAILALLIPPLADQAAGLDLDFQRFIQEAESFLGRTYNMAGWEIDLNAVFRQLENLVRGILQPVFSQTLSLVFEAISSLVWVVFIAIATFYLVKDAPALQKWLEGAVPLSYRDDYLRLRQELNQIWSAFFRGQLVLAFIVAIIFTITGLVIGLPFVLPMALLAGLLEFLPSVGHVIWLAVASLLAFFAGSNWIPIPNWAFMLLVIGLHLIYQQFDLNYLIPRVIGRRLHLPPLVVILGLVTGAVLAGVIGILLAAPTISSARVLGRYLYTNLTDQEPYAQEVLSLPPPNPRWWRKKTSPASPDSEMEK